MDIIVRQLEIGENEKLKHIFGHRVFCREEDGFITNKKFPNGWIDSLDEISIHIVAEYNNEIIGSSRLTIFNSYTIPSIFNSLFETIKFEEESQIALFSKASVSPKFRNMGI